MARVRYGTITLWHCYGVALIEKGKTDAAKETGCGVVRVMALWHYCVMALLRYGTATVRQKERGCGIARVK